MPCGHTVKIKGEEKGNITFDTDYDTVNGYSIGDNTCTFKKYNESVGTDKFTDNRRPSGYPETYHDW